MMRSYTDADTEVTVGITAFELQSGDYYRITKLDRDWV